MAMYRIGDKVVCDFSDWQNCNGVESPRYPKKGVVYQVRNTTIVLERQLLGLDDLPHEFYYWCGHFRPFIDDTVVDIIKMLNANQMPLP